MHENQTPDGRPANHDIGNETVDNPSHARIALEDLSTAESISIGRLIRGFPRYFGTIKRICHNPLSYPHLLDFDNRMQFRHGLEFVTYGVVISFFLLVPAFLVHRSDLSKVTFFMRMVVQFAMYGFLLHVGMKAVGERGASFRKTLTVYAYIVGIGGPLGVLLIYPILMTFGPIAIFGTGKEAIALGTSRSMTPGLLLYLRVANILVSMLAFVVTVSWFSQTHAIGKWRVLFAVFIAGGIGGLTQLFVLHPLFNVIFVWVDEVLKYT